MESEGETCEEKGGVEGKGGVQIATEKNVPNVPNVKRKSIGW